MTTGPLLKPQVAQGARLGWRSSRWSCSRCSGCGARPTDAVQGDAQRLMYLHVPAAWLAYLAFGVTALGVGAVPLAAHPLDRSGTASPARRPSSA